MPGELDDREEIDALAWWVAQGIRLAGALLLLLFAWLEISKAQVVGLVVSTAPDLLLKSSLAVYYTCWIFGSAADLNLHKVTLAKDPNAGKIPLSAYFVFVGFILAAIALIRASRDPMWFAGALAAFWIILTAAGEYTRRLTTPMIHDTGQWYRRQGDFYRLEKLIVVTRYLYGPCMWHRNITGFVLIALLGLVTFSDAVRVSVAAWIHTANPEMPLVAILPLMPAAFFALFVIVTEGWQWYMRANTISALNVLGGLRRKYDLSLRS